MPIAFIFLPFLIFPINVIFIPLLIAAGAAGYYFGFVTASILAALIAITTMKYGKYLLNRTDTTADVMYALTKITGAYWVATAMFIMAIYARWPLISHFFVRLMHS